MLPSKRSRPRRAKRRPHNDSLSFPFNRCAMRQPMRVDNTTPSIPPIASWLANWNDGGMRRCRPFTGWKARAPPSSRGGRRPFSDQERQQLLQLGADLERAWTHPAATAATRKRILRTALNEIVVRRDGAIIHAVLHWQGGDHTE